MKLSQWAKNQGICYRTAWRWFHQGKLPIDAKQTESGTILVFPQEKTSKEDFKVWIYCRVSSYEKQEDLNRQAIRCQEFCNARGWEIQKVVKEIASGMNDKRPKLINLFDQNPSRIVVEHKDRLTRFGFNYIDHLLKKTGCELIVINRSKEETSDLMVDLISIITSFCCRLYGMRRGYSKAKKIKKEIENETSL